MADARRFAFTLTIEGEDVTLDASRDLVSLTYVDNAEDKADDLQVALQDRDGLWSGPWFPPKGARVEATITDAVTGQTLPCGTFEIDDVTVSGPPSVVKFKAASTPIEQSDSPLRREVHVRTWEGTTLEAIAQGMAEAAGLGLYYEGPAVNYGRVDQYQESNLAFLRRQATSRGLSVKVTDDQLVIYGKAERDASPTVTGLNVGDRSMVKSWRLRTKANDIYSACRVRYHDASGKQDTSYTYTPDNPPTTDQVLEVQERAENIAAARQLARSRLREKNEQEVTGSLDLVGLAAAQAGMTIGLAGAGALSGTYFVKTARHSIDGRGGYGAQLEVRQAMEY